MLDHAKNMHSDRTKHVVVGGCCVLANIQHSLQATIMAGGLACMVVGLEALEVQHQMVCNTTSNYMKIASMGPSHARKCIQKTLSN